MSQILLEPVSPARETRGTLDNVVAKFDECPAHSARKESTQPRLLRALFSKYRCRLLVTYFLFNLENILRLAQPFFLGLAITDLLQQSFAGLFLLAGQHIAHLVIGAARRMYDTRAFTGIYNDMVSRLVLDQRSDQVEVSRIAARSALSRQIVSFFEKEIPFIMQAAYSVIGALVMLAFYDPKLLPICLWGGLVTAFLAYFYGRKTSVLNGRLHDQMEKEVDVISQGQPADVHCHYYVLARWRIRLSDLEALSFGLMELVILALLSITLMRSCAMPGADAGYISAVLGYVLMYALALINLPALLEQLNRLRDIGKRMQ